MHRFLIMIEQGPEGYSAYAPDLPGCVAAAETREETIRLMQEAIEFHLEGLAEDGLPIPIPHADAEFISVRSAT